MATRVSRAVALIRISRFIVCRSEQTVWRLGARRGAVELVVVVVRNGARDAAAPRTIWGRRLSTRDRPHRIRPARHVDAIVSIDTRQKRQQSSARYAIG